MAMEGNALVVAAAEAEAVKHIKAFKAESMSQGCGTGVSRVPMYI
jgi:hypothetical protein